LPRLQVRRSANSPVWERPLPVAIARATIVGRPATLVITMVAPALPTTVHLAAQPAPAMIGAEDGATIDLANGSPVTAWASAAEDTEFAGTASVLPVVSNARAGALSPVTIAVQRKL
jgi:hypothetical protein